MPPKGTTRLNVIGPLKDFFEAHPGETIKIHRLITATGFDDEQIRSAINNARKNGYPLDVVTRGQAWVLTSIKEETPVEPVKADTVPRDERLDDDERGFYQLNTDKEGNPILQRDSDGTIWVARRI